MAILPFRSKTVALQQQVATLTERVTELTSLTEERTTQVMSTTQNKAEKAGLLGGSKQRELMVLYDAYLQTPWLSGPIDVIAKRMTSGGVTIEPLVKGANPANKATLENLIQYCNEEEDIVELAQLMIAGLLIFGAGQWEVVDAGGHPYELYSADPVTVLPVTDEKGTLLEYVQRLGNGEVIHLMPEQILRVTLRGARGEQLGPIRKLLTSATVYSHMMRWNQKFFEHGARPPGVLELPEKTTRNDAERQTEWLEEHVTGVENAGTMPVMYGGAKLTPWQGSSGVEFDFLGGLQYVREEFLTVLGVPLSQLGLVQKGGLANEGESMDKAFRNNTINNLRRVVEEKLTYRLAKKGFGIQDWAIRLKEASYDSDQLLVELVLQKVGGGLINRNEGRQQLGENGKLPGKGGDIASITYSRGVIPVEDLPQMHSDAYLQTQQQAVQTGLDPKMKPSDLAAASPRDPMSSGDDHPVAAQDKRADAQAKQQPLTKEAVADLARWQRVALRCLREDAPLRPFESEHLEPGFLTETLAVLDLAATPEEVRQVFDAAFFRLRSSYAPL